MAGMNEEARIPVYINDEQAKSALKTLQSEADKWRKKMYEAMEGGDLKGMKAAETELKKVTKQTAELKREAFDVNKVLSNLSSASITDLNRSISKLRADQKGLNRDTKEYADVQKKIDSIKGEFKKINGQVTEQTGLLGKLKSAAGGLLPAFGFAAIAMTAKKAFDQVIASTDTLGTQWDIFMGGMKGATNEFFRTIATGDWSNFLHNMREAVRVGREYEAVLDMIEERQRALSIAEADSRGEIVKLEEALKNTGLTDKERLDAGYRRIQIEEELAVKRTKNTKSQFENELMMATQQSRLSKEQLMQVAADFDSEKKLRAQRYNQIKEEHDRLSAAQKGSVYGTQNAYSSANTPRITELKSQMAGFNTDVVEYAGQLSLLGNVTDEQMNKVVAAYSGMKDAEVSGRESIKRVITMVNSIEAKEINKGGGKGGSKTKATKGPDFADMLKQDTDAPLDDRWITQKLDKEALALAEKKATEAEWTAFLKKQIDERLDAEAKALDKEKEVAEARKQLKGAYADAIGQVAGALASMFKEGSAAQIAALAVEKGAAIAQIIFQTAIANAKAVAISPLTAGQPWVTINSLSAGASIAAIAATTITAFKDKKNNDKPGFVGGGFTEPGDRNQPAGIVHAGEWVSPQEGVNNPNVRRFIDIFETARRNGSLARLDLSQIMQSLPTRQMSSGGYSSSGAGFISPPSSAKEGAGGGSSDPELKQMMQAIIQMTKEIRENPPRLPIDQFERERKKYIETQQNNGL